LNGWGEDQPDDTQGGETMGQQRPVPALPKPRKWARKKRFVALFMVLLHVLGAITSVQAVMETRTSQGAIAWAISLNTFPYAALPAYWIFGRTKFNGYVKKRRDSLDETNMNVRRLIEQAREQQLTTTDTGGTARLVEQLAKLPATSGNEALLLRNGEQIFSSIFEGIENAREYVLVQFYIVRDDNLGQELQKRLVAAAERNVRIFFLYDEIGCYRLPRSYLDILRNAGVQVEAFNSTKGSGNRFQLNFRNHRKIVVVDGRYAWVGGSNVGDEYMGRHPTLTPWVDAVVRIRGPAVQFIQVPFLEDWFWATEKFPDLDWTLQPAPVEASQKVLTLPSGPADRFETCALYYLDAIHAAKSRFWVASPYFVPDEQIVSALKLAALRGVDVRVVVPDKCDQFLVNLSGWSFIEPLVGAGVKLYRFTGGVLHHKVMLADNYRSAIGSANFDNRSFRLNFEMTVEVQDEAFAREVERLFMDDFAGSRLTTENELEARSFPFRLAVQVARLLAPVQ
jgi:cardiolipin synthase